jgi:hypothetical protein
MYIYIHTNRLTEEKIQVVDKKRFNFFFLITRTSKTTASQVPVAHAHNPSYSRGRDQEDGKPAQVVKEILSWKKPITQGLLEWLKC